MQKLDEVILSLNDLALAELYVIIECAQELIDSAEEAMYAEN